MLRPWGRLLYPVAPWRVIEFLTAKYPAGGDGSAAACCGPTAKGIPHVLFDHQ
ncbi:MAG: hypothetical protein QNJ45_01060 [Ardenticatenaceae bacterium]|nr:hypothetical protein [Ardenticatenaceae bacterium]